MRGNTLGMTPQSRAIPTLLTRPRTQGDRFGVALAERFGGRLSICVSPLIAPHFMDGAIEEKPYSALILTSETGALSAARHGGLPRLAYCVGDRTAATARTLGLTAISADGDATALVALILSSGETGPLLHLRGKDARGDIAATLQRAGLWADEAVTYDQRPEPLTAEARAMLDGAAPVLLPLFSPRTAAILAAQGPFPAPLMVAALSPSVAEAAATLFPVRQAIADAPNADALLTAISTIVDVPIA